MATGRRVRRVIRKIDVWSVLKVTVAFFLSIALIIVLAAVLLWAAADILGVVGGFEKFMSSVGFENFRFLPGQLFRGFLAFSLVLVLLGTGLSVLAAVLYNLISDVIGGLELSILEEEVEPVRVPAPATEARTVRAEEHQLAPGYPA